MNEKSVRANYPNFDHRSWGFLRQNQWIRGRFSDPLLQVPLAQLQNNQILKSRLSKFTVSADGEFVQVPLAQITWYHHISRVDQGTL